MLFHFTLSIYLPTLYPLLHCCNNLLPPAKQNIHRRNIRLYLKLFVFQLPNYIWTHHSNNIPNNTFNSVMQIKWIAFCCGAPIDYVKSRTIPQKQHRQEQYIQTKYHLCLCYLNEICVTIFFDVMTFFPGELMLNACFCSGFWLIFPNYVMLCSSSK